MGNPTVLIDRFTLALTTEFTFPRRVDSRDMLERTFIPHKLLSRQAFGQFALDWLWCGNAYLERRQNMLGQALSLQPTLAKYMRRGADLETYYQVRGWKDEHEFKAGTICHLREADINQEVYGLPEWLSALQSALLNESATLFRRRYHQNGSHAGFIMYMTDAAEGRRCRRPAQGAEISQGAGQLPQPVHVRTWWQEGRHSAAAGERSGGEG